MTEADYTDIAALDRFANDVDVVTYEFENVPAETATFLSARKPVLPDPNVLAITQDRLIEKDFVHGARHRHGALRRGRLAGRTARPRSKPIGRPAVLKTRRFGYDGKGQVMIRNGAAIAAATVRRSRRAAAILEALRAVRARDFGGRGARRATARSNAST